MKAVISSGMDILMIGQREWPPHHEFRHGARTAERDHLVMPRRGRARFLVADEEFLLQAEELLLIPVGIPHAWRVEGDEPYAARWLQLRLSRRQRERLCFRPTDQGVVHLPVADERQAVIDPIMTRLLQLTGRGGAEVADLRQLLVRALLQEITLFHGTPMMPRSEVVARVLDHLDRHLADPELSLRDLVQAAGCARSVMMERFSSEVGVPPMRYLEARRLDVAADWLANSQDAVAAIAAAVGYADSRYFATRFRRRFGLSPRRYRTQAVAGPALGPE